MKKLFVCMAVVVGLVGLSWPAHAEDLSHAQKGVAPSPVAKAQPLPLSDAHKVNYADVPEVVKKAAEKRIGKARVEDVDKGTVRGKIVYDLAYKKVKNSNQKWELRVTDDGKVMGERKD
jgi:hypothetical protein